MSGKEELRNQIRIMDEMAEANICRMPDNMLSSLAQGLKAVMHERYARGLSREDVARYFGISTRTLERWQKEKKNFPQPKRHGTKDVSYDAEEIIEWKRNNINNIL